MSISISDYELPYETHNLYDVNFYNDTIHTLVTHTPSFVDSWISEIESIHSSRLHHLIVGLDVEWRPSFQRNVEHRAATIQLCVGKRCLIFQLIHSPYIPQTLISFLNNVNYTFVGVGIESDVEKLIEDYGLGVQNTVDLRGLGNGEEYKNAGLKSLALGVLGKEVVKPKRVALSRWDSEWLTIDQVQYACLDAFLSFSIGRVLNASSSTTRVLRFRVSGS